MKSILLSALFFLSLVSSFSQKYSEVKIHTSREGLATLGRMGIPVDEGYFDKSTFQTVIPAELLEQIRKAGFIIDVIHEDYPDFISKRNRDAAREIEMINAGIRSRSVNVSNYPVPVHFELGTMGGYYTLQEVMNELDSMHALYPSLVTQKAVCTSTPTHLGRNLYYVRITNLNNTQAKPKVLYNALTHAREPMGMQQLMFYMWYLLENYSSSNEVKYLLDNLDLYFIPVVNPDGYEYNHSTNPNGGGGWRKNRRDNGGSYGVDLNRNFGYFWGFDDTGSSPVPSEDNYRGPSAFSEPETQTVRDFCIANHMVISMNYHTFSNLFLFPWCYTTKYTTDSLLDVRYAEIMTRQNRYVTGLPGEVLYNTNGDVNDWLYGDVNMKPKVISFTAEIGSSLDGFWPNVSRILPLCQENMYQNLMIAHMGYRYAEAKDASDAIVGEKQGYFSFDFTRYGMEPGGTYTISLQPLDSSQFVSVGDPVVISDPAKLIPLTDSIAYTLAPGITAGTQFRYIIRCDNGQFTFTDTVSKWYGKEMVVFSDSCNGMQYWSGNPWSATPFIYHSGPAAITDSPSGPYPNNTNSMVATRESIDLRDSPVA
ncbi:MAG: M14 family metallopeptidase, partial [Syntrophothermus sp.]